MLVDAAFVEVTFVMEPWSWKGDTVCQLIMHR